MKKKSAIPVINLIFLVSLIPVSCAFLISCQGKKTTAAFHHTVNIDFSKKHQSIDGFGVNINPAMWHNGKLKPTIDMLVDDLGATLFRFDCYGQANWFDPSKRDESGCFPEEYLKQVYTSAIFSNAWATFRYLNSKGIKPFFNVSGAIPVQFAGKTDGRSKYLADFDGYAEMVATMLDWARNKEHLKFDLLEPFNETDLAQAEGPKIPDENCPLAIRAIANKLMAHGMGDVRIMAMGDFEPNPKRIATVVATQYPYNNIFGFSHHTYGDGMDEDGNPETFKQYIVAIQSGKYKQGRIWISEYGDLDQTNEYEFGVGWNSSRRLLTLLSLGYNAALVWDAFDNFHAHDSTWSNYGLVKLDTINNIIIRKPRYYAAKQVYKFVLPGYALTESIFPFEDPGYAYNAFASASRLVKLQSFISPSGEDYTIVGMNKTDNALELIFNIKGLSARILSKKVSCYQTTLSDKCKAMGELSIINNRLKFVAAPRSIFTLTSLK